MLSALAGANRSVAEKTEVPLDLTRLSPMAPAIYPMLAQADTAGPFQFESRAQAQVLPRQIPRNYSDIVITNLLRLGRLSSVRLMASGQLAK
jgi:error-prone DNA polymerase